MPETIEKRSLKGLEVTALGLGGQGALEDEDVSRDTQLAVVQAALDAGITHFDTSPLYGDGNSEEVYGEILPAHSGKVTVATKTEARDRDGALSDIEKSLKRLKLDKVNIWFIHHLESVAEARKCARKGGVLEAMSEMKQHGVTDLVGVSGHEDPMAILKMVDMGVVDVILIPVNPADPAMRPSFVRDVIPAAREAGVGVIGMKVMSQGHLFSEDGISDPVKAVRYAVSRDVDCAIVACMYPEQVAMNAKAAAMGNLDPIDMDTLENLVKGRTREACFFRKEFGGYSSKDELEEPWLK